MHKYAEQYTLAKSVRTCVYIYIHKHMAQKDPRTKTSLDMCSHVTPDSPELSGDPPGNAAHTWRSKVPTPFRLVVGFRV